MSSHPIPQKSARPPQPSNHISPRQLANLTDCFAPHVKSFEHLIQCLSACEDGTRQTISIPDEPVVVEFALSNLKLHKPALKREAGNIKYNNELFPLFPRECRERKLNYGGQLTATLTRRLRSTVDNSILHSSQLDTKICSIPIMLCSSTCRLYKQSPTQLQSRGEEELEMGGYFIVGGNERVIRMLQLSRRNYAMAIERKGFRDLGDGFTSRAIQTRCVPKSGHISSTITLHYLSSGLSRARIRIKKSEYNIPLGLLLKSLTLQESITDSTLISKVAQGALSSSFAASRIEMELRSCAKPEFSTAEKCRAYLGSQFRGLLKQWNVTPLDSDNDAGRVLIEQFILIQCDTLDAKREFLIEMTRKLYAFAEGRCCVDDPDSFQHHELLLGGHVLLQMLNEGLQMACFQAKMDLERKMALPQDGDAANATKIRLAKEQRKKVQQDEKCGMLMQHLDGAFATLQNRLFSFLATGNLNSVSGLDMSQTSGFTMIPDRLNRLRYLSHFASVHRGRFFAEMKSTMGRKLLPEAFGFLCPVHTPDGAPCGVLNHLACLAAPVTQSMNVSDGHDDALLQEIKVLASQLGANGFGGIQPAMDVELLPIMLDGQVVAHASQIVVEAISKELHLRKIATLAGLLHRDTSGSMFHAYKLGDVDFPTARVLTACAKYTASRIASLEIAYLPPLANKTSPWPGLFLFSHAARCMRPVIDRRTGHVELIGPLEQINLHIAFSGTSQDEVNLTATHQEINSCMSMLSLVASLTPFSDFNQSPRNMYQCQMGKQTMGTPVHSFRFRPDNKLYRIQNPQRPLVQTLGQHAYAIDEYPNGCNAVVAVIAYTGYDMDDACIINKSSMERGFGHGWVYKTHFFSAETPGELLGKGNADVATLPAEAKKLEADGLPAIGTKLHEGDPFCLFRDETSSERIKYRIERHKEAEPCVVETIRVYVNGTDGTSTGASRGGVGRSRGSAGGKTGMGGGGGICDVSITVRYDRTPVVGDKFSSRHGQKGVLSVLWPQRDMPFSESGMTPDVLINPHAFPSRMTIGMLVESMAGKAAALHGVQVDATPFEELQGDRENQTAVDYFGKQLVRAGYAYHGSEPMYSGTSGQEMMADIFIGAVYYQRLRHMVSDKSQVRSTGPVDPVTRQPIKGRKRHGGVRFGEMERDSLISHGAAFLVQDRLLNCSDRHTAQVCCGSLMSVGLVVPSSSSSVGGGQAPPSSSMLLTSNKYTCRICGKSDQWKFVVIPYALRYLVVELMGMGVNVKLEC